MSWRSAYALDTPTGQIAKSFDAVATSATSFANGVTTIYTLSNLPKGVYQVTGSYSGTVTIGASGSLTELTTLLTTNPTATGSTIRTSYVTTPYTNPSSTTTQLVSVEASFNYTLVVTSATNTYYVTNYLAASPTGYNGLLSSKPGCSAIKIA
jgi:hypothetical protein